MVIYCCNACITVKNHKIIHSHNGHYGKKCSTGQYDNVQRSQKPTFATFFTVMGITEVNNFVFFYHNACIMAVNNHLNLYFFLLNTFLNHYNTIVDSHINSAELSLYFYSETTLYRQKKLHPNTSEISNGISYGQISTGVLCKLRKCFAL